MEAEFDIAKTYVAKYNGVSDGRILFSCLSCGALRGILLLHSLFCDLDAITSYSLFSSRLFRLDLMIKHDFCFSLDLDPASFLVAWIVTVIFDKNST